MALITKQALSRFQKHVPPTISVIRRSNSKRQAEFGRTGYAEAERPVACVYELPIESVLSSLYRLAEHRTAFVIGFCRVCGRESRQPKCTSGKWLLYTGRYLFTSELLYSTSSTRSDPG